MLYQRTPLPADIDYFLDGALDCDEISALCFNAITLLGDRKIVPSIIDAEPLNDRRLSLRNRRERALALDDYAHQLVLDLAPHEQAAFYASGMLREPLKLYGLAEWLCSWNHEDETIGGCGKPYLDRTRHDKNYDPTPRVRRRLYSPSSIRRYVKLEAQCIPYARRLAEPLSRLPIGKPEEAQLIIDLLNEQREAYRETIMAARAKFEADQRRRYGITEKNGLAKVERKAVVRAAAFAAGVVGSEQLSAFTQGRPILLQGQNMALEVSSRGNIARLGHGGLTVHLCTPAGDRLSGLCVYFDKTPVLDQVAAIALHLQAGCEAELVETGNLYAITPLGALHPIVTDRVKKMKTEPGRAPRDTDKDRKTAAQARYKADTLRIYFDAVTTTVWGRHARRLDPFHERLIERYDARNLEMAA